MKSYDKHCEKYGSVEGILYGFMSKNTRRFSLDGGAALKALSSFRVRGLLTDWSGASPEVFFQSLSAGRIKKALRSFRQPVFSLPVRAEKNLGGGEKPPNRPAVAYGFYPSPFGEYLAAATGKKICALDFAKHKGRKALLEGLKKKWPGAELYESARDTRNARALMAAALEGKKCREGSFYLRGTPFQVEVWKALLKIPYGALASYSDVAAMAGRPRAVRAAASAVGGNPVSYLVPCHRVVHSSGDITGYGGGTARKAAMIGWEAARRRW